MRPGQQNKRMRGRSRRGPSPLSRSLESNGPDVKIRGTASHIAEKYTQLARDAQTNGDHVAAENYYQHAEHYLRIIAAAQAQTQQNASEQQPSQQHGQQQPSQQQHGQQQQPSQQHRSRYNGTNDANAGSGGEAGETVQGNGPQPSIQAPATARTRSRAGSSSSGSASTGSASNGEVSSTDDMARPEKDDAPVSDPVLAVGEAADLSPADSAVGEAAPIVSDAPPKRRRRRPSVSAAAKAAAKTSAVDAVTPVSSEQPSAGDSGERDTSSGEGSGEDLVSAGDS